MRQVRLRISYSRKGDKRKSGDNKAQKRTYSIIVMSGAWNDCALGQIEAVPGHVRIALLRGSSNVPQGRDQDRRSIISGR